MCLDQLNCQGFVPDLFMFSNYRPYTQQTFSQQNPNNQPQISQPTYQQNVFPQSNHLNQPKQSNRSTRAMYSSTIQSTTLPASNLKPKTFGLGKLENMGRFIQQVSEPTPKTQETHQVTNKSNPNSLNSVNNTEERPKMSNSVIFNRTNDDELNRFPSFNLQTHNQNNAPLSKLDALMNRNKLSQSAKQEPIQQTPEDKRKRQIFTIKQQLQSLNKKIQNKQSHKTENNEIDKKPYFQLPSRKSVLPTPSPNTSNNEPHLKSSQINPHIHQTANNQPLYYQKNTQNTMNQFASNASTVSTTASISNNFNSFKPKTDEGGMFKKKAKSPFPTQQVPQSIKYQEKHIFASTTANSIPTPQFKSAQIVQNAKPKQSSIDYKETYSKSISTEPKSFKKSDFAIGKQLGKGQYGEVMLVQHKHTGFIMGLKVMSKKQIREERYENQIARQLSINFYLAHRNIAPLYGYFSDEENVYLLVQYCTNGQLLSLLCKNRRMEDAQVSPIIKQICEGLDYVHKEGIIHRDIKPENILFNFNTVKICDFGWAVYSANGMRKTVSGSPLYYSPEVVLQTAYDEKIDIWAIGMMTYECLLGKIPFRIYSELDLNRIDEIKFPEYVDVSEDAKDFILKIMKKKPEQRMQIKQMMRHPFITKYLKNGKLTPDIMESFRKVLS